MNDIQLLDYYRVLHPNEKKFTWRKKKSLKTLARLDYILTSESLSNMVEKVFIKSGYRSDHSAVVIEFKFNKFTRGRGLWKFNNSLLTDKTYIDKVKETILRVQNQYKHSDNNLNYIDDDLDHSIFLEVLLMEIRSITISHSSFKKKERDKIENALLEEIEVLESDSNINLTLLEQKKAELENVRKEKLQGHIIRSRAKWVEEGEKPSKYFCSLESRNFLNKTIKKVETQEGQVIYDQSQILHHVKDFYETLYSCKDSDLVDINLEDIIKSSGIPKLEKTVQNSLDEMISDSEIYTVLKNMKNNKSPGSDGFTVEFYKFFWKDIKNHIVAAVNHIFKKKELPISQRLGIITCLPKGDKPRQFLKNWRPITLLNVFYKIISGCLSYRIKNTLDCLISETQSGFIKGRYIGDNTRFVYDLMSFTELTNTPGLLVLIDFEKAFDSISWKFMYKVLNYFGFGDNFITWIKILNTNIKASVLQSGFLSEQLDVQRGCRQGDPIAPYLFILCAEILAILVKQNKDIKGITMNGKEQKISQYADDTSLALDGSPKSLFAALDAIDYYSTFSGLRINSSKTKIVWIGSKKFSKEVYHHTRWKLEWGCTTFNLLGIEFSVDMKEIVDLNYNSQIPKIKALIHHWKRRKLTPIGRVTVVKSLLLPKLNHLFIALPNPDEDTLSSLNKYFFEYIWNSKTDKVKRQIVTQDYLKGGLKMVDIKMFLISLKCTWIKRLTNSHKPWLDIFFEIHGSRVVHITIIYLF